MDPGDVTLEIRDPGEQDPLAFRLGNPPTVFDIDFTGTFSGPVEVCIDYTGITWQGQEENITVFHFDRDTSDPPDGVPDAWGDPIPRCEDVGGSIPCQSSQDLDNNIICVLVSDLSPFAVFEPIPGSIVGRVTADCLDPGAGLQGVNVDAYEMGNGAPVMVVTDASGDYEIDSLLPADYMVTVVTPLGYNAGAGEEVVVSVAGDVVRADFSLSCVEIVPSQRSQGFWKHQVGVALGGKGRAQIDSNELCDYLDSIAKHFNSNGINQVVVYVPPESDECVRKLGVARELLNLKGNVGMTSRAKQQLMALLLNVASGKLSLTEIISEDGATVSQAVTYCDLVIDDGNSENDESARDVADMINNAIIVPEGRIPLTAPKIAYSRRVGRGGFREESYLASSHPNPFNPSTVIEFGLASPSHVRLAIYNVLGREVKTLVDEHRSAGDHAVSWDGKNNSGSAVSNGVYFCKIAAGDFEQVRKLVLLK
jgi:hypothetical protein